MSRNSKAVQRTAQRLIWRTLFVIGALFLFLCLCAYILIINPEATRALFNL